MCFYYATFTDKHMAMSRKYSFSPLNIIDAYKKHVYHWVVNPKPDLQQLIIKYENLILTPEEEFQHIFDFLELPCTIEKTLLNKLVSQYSKENYPRAQLSTWKKTDKTYGILIDGVEELLSSELQILDYT